MLSVNTKLLAVGFLKTLSIDLCSSSFVLKHKQYDVTLGASVNITMYFKTVRFGRSLDNNSQTHWGSVAPEFQSWFVVE